MRTLRTPHSRASLAGALAAVALLMVAALALAACGGEAASATPPPASPSPTASPATAPDDETGSVSPSGASSDGTKIAACYESPPSYPTEAWTGSGTVGWIFRPKVDIKVTELGCYDADQDGLANTHRVGIFDARSDRLLASVKVGPGSALEGAFRWESLDKPLMLKAGYPYAVGTTPEPAVEGRDAGHETLYEEGMEQWAPEIHFGGLRTNMGSRVAFSAPTSRKLYFGWEKIAWMSPNFKFERVVRLTGEADNPTYLPDFKFERVARLTSEADNPTYLDVPGTASLAQTEEVARRWAAALSAWKIPGAGLYADDATRDVEGGVTRGAQTIEKAWYDSYNEDPSEAVPRRWSKDYHLLAAPGIAVWEGAHADGRDDPWRWDLVLLAVDGDKIAHEEVYFEGNGLENRWPMQFCDASPGPGDTAEVAASVAAAVGEAFATRDRDALEALLASVVIFPEIDDRPGPCGRDTLLDWWAMLPPRSAAKIVIKDETPLAGPGWAVVRWTARRWDDNPVGFVVSANMATVIEVRGGKVVRIVPYGSAEGGESGLLAP